MYDCVFIDAVVVVLHVIGAFNLGSLKFQAFDLNSLASFITQINNATLRKTNQLITLMSFIRFGT